MSGQAAVESALTLPLTVFLILGILQLFMMTHARLMTQYAAFSAVRTGSVTSGDCRRMTHAAIGALVPTFDSYMNKNNPGTPAQQLARAVAARTVAFPPNDNQFNPTVDFINGVALNRAVVWIIREQPLAGAVPNPQDLEFDAPGKDPMRLEVRLIYWYPLRIPFANWVMSYMFLAYFGLQNYRAANPLMLAQTNTNWAASGAALDPLIAAELRSRVLARQYAFPIQGVYGMRMMTPARRANFGTQNCPPAP